MYTNWNVKTADQVIHWAVWVMKEFNIDEMEIGSIHIQGRDLCAFSQDEFLQKVPNGEILWSHLELLRKCKSNRAVVGFRSVCVQFEHSGHGWRCVLRTQQRSNEGCILFVPGTGNYGLMNLIQNLRNPLYLFQMCWQARTSLEGTLLLPSISVSEKSAKRAIKGL